MSFEQIDPTRMYQISGQVYPLQTGCISLAIAVGTTVIAASATQRHRIFGVVAQTNGAAPGLLILKAGAAQKLIVGPGTTAAGLPFTLPVIDSGYWETATNEAVLADVTTTAIYLTISYITYTP